VIALSVAAVLAVFLVYTSLAGGTPSLQPSELKGRSGTVALAGKVVGPIRRDGRTIRFRLRDVQGTASVPVVYTGSVPDLFAPAKDIGIQGELRRGVFVGNAGTLVTKCPSKYAPERSGRSDGSA
jgi:cytochrome c-type biogenesis protein CcmE